MIFITISNCFFFFFNDTATTEIYTLSLHDALPILALNWRIDGPDATAFLVLVGATGSLYLLGAARGNSREDRKSTRLNSSHSQISYAVFCLKKKQKQQLEDASDYTRHFCDDRKREH